jgi:hypothetical protein
MPARWDDPLERTPIFWGVDREALARDFAATEPGVGESTPVPADTLLYVAEGCVGLRWGPGLPIRQLVFGPRVQRVRRPMVVEALLDSELWCFPWARLPSYAGELGWPDWHVRLMIEAIAQRGALMRQRANDLGDGEWTHHHVDGHQGRKAVAAQRLKVQLQVLPFESARTDLVLPAGLVTEASWLAFAVGRIENQSWSRSSSYPTHDVALLLQPTTSGWFVHRAWASDMEAMVHGRRRYGLPMDFALIGRGRQARSRWAVVARGQPVACLDSSLGGGRPYRELNTPGRLLAQRHVPEVGGRSGLMALDLPLLEPRRASTHVFESKALAPTRTFASFTLGFGFEAYPARWEAP